MTVRSGRGLVRGNRIELAEDLGLTDGQEVEVVVRVRPSEQAGKEGIRDSAGGMVPYWTPEDDRILAEIESDRRRAPG